MPYTDKDKQRQAGKCSKIKRTVAARQAVISKLGGACVMCGNADSRVLQIDHVKPVHRPERHGYQIMFYKSILSGVEDNVQLLCANCHMIKTAEDFGYNIPCEV